METFAVVFLICFAVALLMLARPAWRFFRGNEQPAPAGSFGQQFLGKRDKSKKPEDWLDQNR